MHERTFDGRQGAEPLFRWPTVAANNPTIPHQQTRELIDLHNQAIEDAPDIPANNRLPTVQNFLRLAIETRDLRKVIREPQVTPEEKNLALGLFTQKRQELQGLVDKHGLSLEKALREYVKAKQKYLEFVDKSTRIEALRRQQEQPTFASLPENQKFDPATQARLDKLTAGQEPVDHRQEVAQTLTALAAVYTPGSPEYQQLETQLLAETPSAMPTSKAALVKKIAELEKETTILWNDPLVRNFAHSRQMREYVAALAQGEDVVETPSVIEALNKLNEWETLHTRTTIGGVLVGPPGVGKTTLVRHYLEQKGRHYVYIDLSEDVTRYLLYGSKSIELKSGPDYLKSLVESLEGLSEGDFRNFVSQNASRLTSIFGLSQDEATVTLLNQLDEALNQARANELREHIISLAKRFYHAELASQFSDLVHKNGWRDGVIIAALRRGDSLILDEFNKYRNWSLIFGLLTARPGTSWYFSDNDEYIPIPADWRMYFTANIGRKHGGFVIPEALASRAEGKIMEIDYPPAEEELDVALAALSNPAGIFLRPEEDMAKLYYLINEAWPRIRAYIGDKNQIIPVYYRMDRDIAEKLVTASRLPNGRQYWTATKKTFDEAVYEVMVESYKLYEDQTIPREIINLLTVQGILLSDSVRGQVEPIVGQDEYKKRREEHEKNRQDYLAVIDRLKGITKPPSPPAETGQATA